MKRITVSMMILVYALLAFGENYQIKTGKIEEASGLAHGIRNKDVLYTINDSGGEASVYLLNTKGEYLGEWRIKGIKNRDWEEISSGKGPKEGINYLYIGEIGDNRAVYPFYSIYRICEAEYKSVQKADSIEIDGRIDYEYEDGKRDAEAFFVDPITKAIIIISKREAEVGIYRISKPQDKIRNTAKKIGTLPMQWVTAAEISEDGRFIIVKTYMGIWMWERKKGEAIEEAFKRSPVALEYEIEPQGEAVCFDTEAKGYFTLSEKSDSDKQILHYYKMKR